MSDLKCPYCGAGCDVCHDDGYDEDFSHEMECKSCGKVFVFRTEISYTYTPRKADCLNGEPHNLGEWRHSCELLGFIRTRRACVDCGYSEIRTERLATGGGKEEVKK